METTSQEKTSRRPSISKALRFEVFKRDSFTCQYCGRRAPDVVLHCDHVKPLIEGGEHTILNLTTACVDCNLGKGPRELSDQAVLSKQLNQLAALQERKEQMEMMIDWQQQLSSIDEMPITHLGEQWKDATGYSWTDTGKSKVRKLIGKFSVELVAKAMQTSLSQYLERDETGTGTAESVDRCFDGMCAITKVEHAELREPGTKRMYLIRGGLRRRFHYCNEWLCLSLMKTAARNGVSLDYIEEVANTSQNWSQFRGTMEALIAECQEQVQAESEWRMEILECFSEFRKNVSDDTIIGLIARALNAGMSEKYLIGIARDCQWHAYKESLEFAIEWRNRMLAPLRSALGGYLPDDEDLVNVHDALCWGMTDKELLQLAHEYGSWPRLKESLSNFADAAQHAEWDRFSAEREQHAPT
jgi:hypothetical protein